MAEESLENKIIKCTVWSAANAFWGSGYYIYCRHCVGLYIVSKRIRTDWNMLNFNTVLSGIVGSGFSNTII